MPLRDATAARGVSPEMRDEVDEFWRAWGIRPTAEDMRDSIYRHLGECVLEMALNFGPLVVYACEGSHAHHLASMGLCWLALLVAESPDINGDSWHVPGDVGADLTPLMVALRTERPVGRGADGKVEWAYALGDREVARMVRTAVATGADVNRLPCKAWSVLSCCAECGCLEAVVVCLAAGAEVDMRDSKGWMALSTPHSGATRR